MKDTIRAVIFDLGRVLVDFDHRIAARKVAALTALAPEKIYALFFDSHLIQRFEEGRLSPEDFFAEVSRLLGLSITFAQFLPVWNEIFYTTPENTRVYTLAKSLKKDYTVVLLSNINVLHFRYLKERFRVFDAFHHIFTSFELGCIKPDPAIYRAVLDRLGIAPHQAFYVDDRPELITQAAELGIRSFVYTGTERLCADLASCGITVPEPG